MWKWPLERLESKPCKGRPRNEKESDEGGREQNRLLFLRPPPVSEESDKSKQEQSGKEWLRVHRKHSRLLRKESHEVRLLLQQLLRRTPSIWNSGHLASDENAGYAIVSIRSPSLSPWRCI